jgi:hypothetical protein
MLPARKTEGVVMGAFSGARIATHLVLDSDMMMMAAASGFEGCWSEE